MLNKSGKSGCLFLIPDLRRQAFSFSPLSMLAVDLTYIIFNIKVLSLYICFVERFLIIKYYWILSNAFSASIEMTILFSSLILLMWCVTLLCWCWPSLHLWNNSYLIMAYDPLNELALFLFTNIFFLNNKLFTIIALK